MSPAGPRVAATAVATGVGCLAAVAIGAWWIRRNRAEPDGLAVDDGVEFVSADEARISLAETSVRDELRQLTAQAKDAANGPEAQRAQKQLAIDDRVTRILIGLDELTLSDPTARRRRKDLIAQVLQTAKGFKPTDS